MTLDGIQGARILLAEDNEINQQVAREFLTKGGLSVTVANNGQEALDWVQSEPFDAVLMDLHMPIMDGFECTRRIRALPQCANIPVIAITAAAMAEDRVASTEAGMDDHIAKPVDPQELADTLVRWIKPSVTRVSEIPASEITKLSIEQQQDVEALESALPGVSIRAALERMGGNQELYRRLLLSFSKRHQGTADKLRELEQAGDPSALYLEAHNLKGEAGNLGLDAINSAADFLGRQIKSGEMGRLRKLTEVLAKQCELALITLDNLEGKAEEASTPKSGQEAIFLDRTQLLPLLDLLMSHLQSKNLAARRTVGELDKLTHGTNVGKEFAEIVSAVQQLRYDVALTSLEQLLDQPLWKKHYERP